MHNSKPLPLAEWDNKPRQVCAVCGMVSYSVGGIHPQCAQARADAPRIARLKAKRKTASKDKVVNPLALNPWHKRCPKCHVQLHIRKLTCDCGHRFS